MSFDPEWCRNEDYQCETCPFTALKDTDPGVAEHTLTLLSIFEPRDVVRAVHDTKTDNDSYEFGVMVEYSGDDIQTFYGETSGYDLARAAILKIASAHNLNS